MNDHDIVRFWSKVDKSGECWIWTGTTALHGYGQFKLDGKMILVHRLSYLLAHGEFADSLLVCHHCDNPPCVRPDHLFLGTHRDNSADMLSKNRLPSRAGERNDNAKLTQELVESIRSEYRTGARQVDLAKKYGVVQPHISRLVRMENWC